MKRRVVIWMSIAAVLGLCSCGAKGTDTANSTAQTSTVSTPSGGGPGLPAGLDEGPRAAESAIDESKAKPGEQLFQSKGCSACHGFGRRISCPDLLGVTQRRTAKWMESQILHPDLMTKQDPTARALFAQFSLQMPNQGLTPDEARTVIEFLKYKDHEAGEGHAEKEDKK